MADGAVGFSTGLQYVPGTYAKTPEIIELARVAGERRRRLRLAHAQRRHGARRGSSGVHQRVGDASARLPRPDLAPQGRQSESMGCEREGAAADRCRPRTRHGGRSRPCTPIPRRARPSAFGFLRGPSKAGRRRLPRDSTTLQPGHASRRKWRAARRARSERPVVRQGRASHRANPTLNGLTMQQVARS